MIGIASPLILSLAVLGALVTVVLHFLSVRRPPVLMLPTMRFLPDKPVRAVSRSARPSDLWLLLLRVAALLLIGIALAGVTWRGTGVKHGRIVVLQQSRSEDVALARQNISQAMRGAFDGDTVTRVVLLDSVARVLSADASQSFRADSVNASPNAARGAQPTLSAAILSAVRSAGQLVREEPTVDAVELTIVAPLARSSLDAAATEARAMWKGPIRILDTHAPLADSSVVADSAQRTRMVTLVGDKPSDAVTSAFEARRWLVTPERAASAAPGVVVAPIAVEWPANGIPTGWTSSATDTLGAIVARGSALVFPFVRTAAIPQSILATGRAIAWWNDGQVAAVEVPTATSCTRHVGVAVPASSDVLSGQGARALLLALTAPCGGDTDATRITDSPEWRAFAGTGEAAAASTFRSAVAKRTPWAALMLLIALGLLVAEWWVRDQEERSARAVDRELTDLRKVA